MVRFIVLVSAVLLLHIGIAFAEDLNPVVGKTGEFVLREADLDRIISYQPAEVQKSVQNGPEQRTDFIRRILLIKALSSQARKEGFEKRPETREMLGYLLDKSLAEEYLLKVVLANIVVTDEEIKTYYSEHEKDFVIPEAVKVRHIFVSSPKDSTAELKDKAKARAEELLGLIKKGEDFGKVAREHSEDSDSAVNGGDLGYITAGKTNSQEFEDAVFALKSGEVSNIIETPFGLHIVRVDEKRPQRTATLDEAKEYIQTRLKEQNRNKKGQEFLDKLAKESGFEITGEKKAAGK